MQLNNVVILSITALILAFKGGYSSEKLIYVALTLPVTMIFAQICIQIFKGLTDDLVRQLLIAMMLFSGSILMAREHLG